MARKAADEAAFVGMLLSCEEGLEKVPGPIVLPVLGQGRLLCAFHGRQLKAEQLGRAAKSACAPCSCRVKELNPGVDLLPAADWEAALDPKRPKP